MRFFDSNVPIVPFTCDTTLCCDTMLILIICGHDTAHAGTYLPEKYNKKNPTVTDPARLLKFSILVEYIIYIEGSVVLLVHLTLPRLSVEMTATDKTGEIELKKKTRQDDRK